MRKPLKPPLSYYGGKQRIASKIVPHIHEIAHDVYVEPFCGGAALLFEKGRPNVGNSDYREVLNDTNEQLVTFYRQAKTNPDELNTMIQGTLHSRAEYKKACDIYKNSSEYSDLEIAWAVFVNLNQSFANGFNKGWAINLRGENTPFTISNKKARLPEQLKRLEQIYIECDDALKIIERWDSDHTLFYIDPPYINSEQGHYAGYSEEDYKNLIQLLGTIKGSFILSGYPNDIVPEEWRHVSFQAVSSAAHGKQRKDLDNNRIERIWIVNNKEQKLKALVFEFARQESMFI